MDSDRPALLSSSNPLIGDARRLGRQRRARADSGRYLLEGIRLVTDALSAGVAVEAVMLREGAERDGVAEVAAAAVRAGVPVHRIQARTFDGLSTTTTPQPALAVAAMSTAALPDVIASTSLALLLVGVADPGNAGTIVRAADAVGDACVVFVADSVDAYNPKTVRAAAGALFRVPIAVEPDVATVFDALGTAGVVTLATVIDGDVDYDKVDLTGSVALVLGSEAHGLEPEIAARCDRKVRIPMGGGAESLNVAMAATVLAFEAARQRRSAP